MRLLVTVLLLGLLATGCGSESTSAPDVAGTWELTQGRLDGEPIPIAARVDLTFEGTELGGTAACNQYGGTVRITGQEFIAEEVFQTEMACETDVMETESKYLTALTRANRITRDGDVLTLTGPDVSLTFERVEPVPDAELTGTAWQLDTLVSGEAASSVLGEPAMLELEDGAIAGSTGCRDFAGRYETRGDEVEVTELSMDDRVCADDLAPQDAHVVEVLGDGFRVRIEGERLWVDSRHGDVGLGYLRPG